MVRKVLAPDGLGVTLLPVRVVFRVAPVCVCCFCHHNEKTDPGMISQAQRCEQPSQAQRCEQPDQAQHCEHSDRTQISVEFTSNSRGAVDREFVYIELESFLLTLLLFLLLPLLSLFFFSFFFFSFTHALCCGLLHACVDRPQEVPQLPGV